MTRLKSQRGQTVIELGLIFLVFASFFFAVLEYSHLFYTKLTLRHSLREAGRYMITGGTMLDPNNPESHLSRPAAAEAVFKRFLMGTGAHLQEFTLTPADGGGPGDTVTLRARFNKPLFTAMFARLFPALGNCPAGQVCFDLNVTWMNEPFAPTPEGGGTAGDGN